MGRDTKIEWCDSTDNPTRGCEGCELWNKEKGGTCYAAAIQKRFHGTPGPYPKPFHVVYESPGSMDKALKWPSLLGVDRPDKPWLSGHKRFIFIGDMSDIFSEAISFEYLYSEIIQKVDSLVGQNHFWIMLTKRPNRVKMFQDWMQENHNATWPHNLMVMTSITSNHTIQRGRILQQTSALWKGLSVEPLLGPVDLTERDMEGLSWVIAGGETGPGARPCHPDWVRSIRDLCASCKVPFFFKQWGEYVPGKRIRVGDGHGRGAQYSYQNECKSPNFDMDSADGVYFMRVGKKEAGRLLDGESWSQMPIEKQAEIVA